MKNNLDGNLWNKIFGIFLILMGLFIFVLFSIWILIIKIIDIEDIIKELKRKENHLAISILEFLKHDEVYCLFFPMLFPILVIYSYSRWTAFNYFKFCD